MPLVLVELISLVVLLLHYCCSYISAISIFGTLICPGIIILIIIIIIIIIIILIIIIANIVIDA